MIAVVLRKASVFSGYIGDDTLAVRQVEPDGVTLPASFALAWGYACQFAFEST